MKWVFEHIIKDSRFAFAVLATAALLVWLNPLPLGSSLALTLIVFAATYFVSFVIGAVVKATRRPR